MATIQLNDIFLKSSETEFSLYNPVYREPQVIAYNRLESRPRTNDFTRSLRAEVRDPLWMLTRQWQMGEFEAEDAGSAIDARVFTHESPVDRFAIKSLNGFHYDENIPLETVVEREAIPFTLALKVQVSHYFLKLHSETLRNKYNAAYRNAFPIPDGHEKDYTGQLDGGNLYQSVKRRDIDGEQLLASIRDGSFSAKITIDATDSSMLGTIGQQLLQWFARQYSQPTAETGKAWDPQRLCYDVSIAATREQTRQYVLDAPRYQGGQLDWYSFELAPNSPRIVTNPDTPEPVSEQTISFLPVAATFKGMPASRFWQLEDRQVNFGNLNATTTDQLLLIFTELGLIYGNDWCVIPYPMKVNRLCEVKGLVVTDVFGDRTVITAADSGLDVDWHHWSMFSLSNKDHIGEYNRQFFLPAAFSQTLESEPIEKVNFIRDEMTNMVWAIEDIIPDATGIGISGDLAANKDGILPEPVTGSTAAIRYIFGTTVPENWIPFLPVHKPGSDQEIYLQRATMPKLGMPPVDVIKAKGVMLNEVPTPYFVNEEEVPYAGTIISRTFQRARLYEGQTYIWLGRYRETGRGEGSSNLRFDQIEPVK
jgi:hypothetical protein